MTSVTSEHRAFPAADLEHIGTRLFGALGADEEIARTVARSLVEANLAGHDSHGIVRVVQYAGWIGNGQIRPSELPCLERASGARAVVDGRWGFGQPAAQMAAREAIARAHEHGVAMVSLERGNHIGRIGEYVEMMADDGLIGMTFCNSGPAVAPYGGNRRVMGTNPFAWAVPRSSGPNVVLDFATSIVAEGKLNVARTEDRSVANGYLVDHKGTPSADPNDYFAGGALLPFGLHKGSGMSMLIELTAGVLSRMGTSPSPSYRGGNGTMMLAFEIDLFCDRTTFDTELEEFCDRAQHGSFDERADILVPGEAETRSRARRADGIPVNDGIRREITVVADHCGVELGEFALR